MSSKSFSLWALALTAVLNTTPTLAQQSSVGMTQDQIHDRVLELCKTPNFGKNIVNWTWEICDEYSTDGGKTWLKVGGWASILALSLVALVQIRKRKIEKEKIADAELGDSEFLWVQFEENPEIDWDGETLPPDDEEIKNESNTIDLVAEADVYAAYKRYEQAIELLQKEMRENPENTNAYLKLAEVYTLLKEDAAINWLSREILSKFESSLSESELKKLIETADTGNIPKDEVIIEEWRTDLLQEGFELNAAWGEDFRDTEKFMKIVEFMYKRGSKKHFNGFYETTQKMEKAGFFKLSELELSQIKAWWHELDPENPIYTELSTPTEKVILIEEAPAVQESIDLGSDPIVPEITEPTTEIAPPVEDIVIAHEEFNPNAIIQSENIFPVQPTESSDILKKPKIMPGIDPPLIRQLERRGFEVIRSEELWEIQVKIIREWSELNVLNEKGESVKQYVHNETYTISDPVINAYLSYAPWKNRIRLVLKNWKEQYIEIIGNVIIK